MFPDLRFVIGAVIATALSGVTLFSLTAAMQISHQSKLAPLEASRLLSYMPDGRHRLFEVSAPRFENPFANIPADPNPVLLQRPAVPAQSPEPPVETPAVAQPAGLAQQPPEPSAVPEPSEQTTAVEPANQLPADDTDAVDERAAIDPPLPLENDTPDAPADSAPAAPSPEPTPAIEPVDGALAAPNPVADTATPAAPQSASDTPTDPAAPDVQLVASLSPAADSEARSDVPAAAGVSELTKIQERTKAKRKRTARKAKKATRPAATRAAQAPTLFNPFASTGYPVTTTSTADRPAKGFWLTD